MSSGKLRKENICLNCGHDVEHLYCSKCGQKNVEIKESFWHLAFHYITDYFHFDSKLLHSIKPLLFKPGFLPKEYMEGRRAKYINPIGSLIFLSGFFFILFLGVGHKNNINFNLNNVNIIDSIQEHIKSDSTTPHLKEPLRVNIGTKSFNDKVSAKLNDLLSGGHDVEKELFLEKFKHNFPKVLVLLIPFLAFFLWLFYFLRKILYVEHVIFVIYTHCFIYLLLIFTLLLSLLWDPAFEWSAFIIFIYIIASMKKFYQQGLSKTIFKFFIVGLCYSFLLIIGFVLNAIFSSL